MSKKNKSNFSLKKLILSHDKEIEKINAKNAKKELEFQKHTEEILNKIHETQNKFNDI